MSYKLYFPKQLCANINLPTSKSISNRALIIYALTTKGIIPNQLARCDDTAVLTQALSSSEQIIDVGAAGTSMRFLTAYYAATPGTHTLTGTERMKNRPIHVLVDALRQLGADISYLEKEGYPPLKIRGKTISNNKIALDGSISSQFITALLLIAPTLQNGLQLSLLHTITSRPYIDMTLKLMSYFGAEAKWIDDQTISVPPQPYKPNHLTIEPDWSAASYWFSIAALAPNSQITLNHLMLPSIQGDAKGAELFKQLGVEFTPYSKGIQLSSNPLIADELRLDFVAIPDLVQTFVVTACLLEVPFYITGVSTLRIKETDRIKALQVELKKLGYLVQAQGDHAIYWTGEHCTPLENPCINTYHDHRMAMAFTPAALKYPNLCINNPEVVTKSYPHFWTDLQQSGVRLLKK